MLLSVAWMGQDNPAVRNHWYNPSIFTFIPRCGLPSTSEQKYTLPHGDTLSSRRQISKESCICCHPLMKTVFSPELWLPSLLYPHSYQHYNIFQFLPLIKAKQTNKSFSLNPRLLCSQTSLE